MTTAKPLPLLASYALLNQIPVECGGLLFDHLLLGVVPI